MKSIFHQVHRDRRGVSLIELLIAVAILAVLSVALMGFMTTGAGAYRSVYGTVSLQTNSQITMNQLQEYLVSCNGGVCVEKDSGKTTLYVLDTAASDSGATLTEHIFNLDSGTQQITYSRKKAAVPESGNLSWTTDADAEVISGNVTDFQVKLNASANQADAATVSITMKKLGKTYSGTQIISLRNTPLTRTNEADLIAAVLAAVSA